MTYERIDHLYSERLKIVQSPDVFSFSLDAVLLAHFTKIRSGSKVVDLCAGNGAVGLFLNYQVPKAHITMMELQPRLADMAQRSIALNHVENDVEMICAPIAEYSKYLKKDSIDTVTCNPPYFINEPQSTKNPNHYLALARHEITTNLVEVLAVGSHLLKMGGHYFMVHRPERLPEILLTMQQHRLAPKRLQFVYPKANKEANIILIEAIKDGKKQGLKVLPPLIVYGENNTYTSQVQTILDGDTPS